MNKFWILDFGFWIRGIGLIKRTGFGISRFVSGNLKSKIQNLKLVVVMMTALLLTAAAWAGEAPKWQADWDKTVEAAKKEG